MGEWEKRNLSGPTDYHMKWSNQRKTNIIYHLYMKSKQMIQSHYKMEIDSQTYKTKHKITKKGCDGGIKLGVRDY